MHAVHCDGHKVALMVRPCDQVSLLAQKAHILNFSGKGDFVDEVERILVPDSTFEHFILLNELLTEYKYFPCIIFFIYANFRLL